MSETETEQEEEIREEEEVAEAARLAAWQIFEVIRRDGEEELERPTSSLVWSGIAAGILISFSVLGEAFFLARLPDAEWSTLIASLGYSAGFLIVILGRMQLFTENTITTILPLSHRPKTLLMPVARLWGIVFAANMVGTTIAAAFIAYSGAIVPPYFEAVIDISQKVADLSAGEALIRGIPAGILIAGIVWMLPSSTGAGSFLVILAFTYLIALGEFTHVIAGSVEVIALVFTGDISLGHAVFQSIVPTFVGNVIGGTPVFALLARCQVMDEL
ncbi:MAG: formate/nitrite transporter family protein [Alphaproteobacteria bacterium]|nr:formate/nitrite transporter family protein [Alphaproteobacteria bacterium]